MVVLNTTWQRLRPSLLDDSQTVTSTLAINANQILKKKQKKKSFVNRKQFRILVDFNQQPVVGKWLN